MLKKLISGTPFSHSRYDSKIIRFYTFLIQVISLATDKMIHVLARTMEMTQFYVLFSDYL